MREFERCICNCLITCEHSKAGHSVDNAKGCMAINEKTGLPGSSAEEAPADAA